MNENFQENPYAGNPYVWPYPEASTWTNEKTKELCCTNQSDLVIKYLSGGPNYCEDGFKDWNNIDKPTKVNFAL